MLYSQCYYDTNAFQFSEARVVQISIQEIVIFCGACSGVVLGNVTVKIPFSIDALISSGYSTSRQLSLPPSESQATALTLIP